ncbi:histidine kinase [Elizabethkingia meningoseptica]|uniref:response regulator transcription factor n=1 Tax=Elizabethkingia meningoseptica TaxID=238 RepID=UPI00099ACEB8|nr:response regulator transcription factor [Elizabethkingia meningoseptica]OPC21531.1 histidine kinase [Elizabethkingia meningoseptica]
METGTAQQKITLAFINEKSPILDLICDGLTASGFEITFLSETIEDGLFQLASLKELPKVCIIDLDFYDKQIISKLQKLKLEYPTIKLIAHSDIDNEKVGKNLLNIGFSSCLLIGSDVDDFRNAINKVFEF